MREKKNHLYVDSGERSILLHSLVELKNQLMQQGRYTDCVDELIFKVIHAPIKKLRVELAGEMMYDKEFKELVKIAVEKLKDESVLKLLQADASYQKDSNSEGSAEDAFHQLDLTEKQREVCQHLIDCREKQDFEYGTHAYIAGLMDAFHIMAVLFPEKWDTERIREALSYKSR